MNELKKTLLSGLIAGEKNNDLSCTLEEIERAQKDLLESDLQLVKSKCLPTELIFISFLISL